MNAIIGLALLTFSLLSLAGNAGPDFQYRCKADGVNVFFNVSLENTHNPIKKLTVIGTRKTTVFSLEEGRGSHFAGRNAEITIKSASASGKLDGISFSCIKPGV